MASSRLPKKSEIKQASDEAYAVIRNWTHNELTQLQKRSKEPICIKLTGDQYAVATFLVKKGPTNEWIANGKYFNDSRSAIFYCAMLHLKLWNKADTILKNDQIVSRLTSEREMFGYRLGEAYVTDDQFKIDVIASRFSLVKGRLANAKTELEKNINDAKYRTRLGINHYEIR